MSSMSPPLPWDHDDGGGSEGKSVVGGVGLPNWCLIV